MTVTRVHSWQRGRCKKKYPLILHKNSCSNIGVFPLDFFSKHLLLQGCHLHCKCNFTSLLFVSWEKKLHSAFPCVKIPNSSWPDFRQSLTPHVHTEQLNCFQCQGPRMASEHRRFGAVSCTAWLWPSFYVQSKQVLNPERNWRPDQDPHPQTASVTGRSGSQVWIVFHESRVNLMFYIMQIIEWCYTALKCHS